MYEREMALNNLILKVRVGSHLYGTNTSESDEDLIGICIPEPKYLMGIKKMEEVDLSITNKDENKKNTKEAIDFKIYTLSKFINLALDNNPNILEILFVNEPNIIYMNNIGKDLLDLRYHFLSTHIKQKFLGYAFSQRKKASIKVDNYKTLKEAIEILENSNIEILADIKEKYFKRNNLEFKIADITLPIATTKKRALTVLKKRFNRFGNRTLLMEKYNYDTKFIMNLIRLLFEGIELLSTGDLKFPLQQKEFLLNIKKGKYELQYILDKSEKLEKMVENLYITSKLSKYPNRELVESFIYKIYKNKISDTLLEYNIKGEK